MNYRTLAATAGMVAALAFASQALAQAVAPRAAAPVAPAAPTLTYGPAPAGVCVFDIQRLAATSLAGKAMIARLKVIQDQVNADLNTQGKQLQADYAALSQAQGTLDQGAIDAKAAQLEVRKAALQRLAQQRNAELEKTQQDATRMLWTAVDPSVGTVFQSQRCAILLDRSAVMIMNPAMDITDAVTANLNTRVPTLNFDRANLSPQAGVPRQ